MLLLLILIFLALIVFGGLVAFVTLSILYGPKNFDFGPDDIKMYICLFASFVILFLSIVSILFPLAYITVLFAIGYYNRKHKRTSFTKHGNIIALKNISDISKENKHKYMMNKAPKSCVEYCEEYRGYDLLVFRKIEEALAANAIDITCAEILWERYNTSSDPKDFPEIDFSALSENPKEALRAKSRPGIIPPERYWCYSARQTDLKRHGQCIMCRKADPLNLCIIKNRIGTREIFICKECYTKFKQSESDSEKR